MKNHREKRRNASDVDEHKVFRFLDRLHAEGAPMAAAAPFIEAGFNVSRTAASHLLTRWMTYAKGRP